MLFLVLLPLTILGLRIGRGVFLLPKYLAKTLNRTTPAVNDTRTICKECEKKQDKILR